MIHQARHHDRFTFVLRHLQIAHERGRVYGTIAEAPADFVHAVIQRTTPLPALGITENVQLDGLML